MGEGSIKRIGRFVISRNGPSFVRRDSAENRRERNSPGCSRVGCSSKLNSVEAAQVGSSYKAKTPKTPFRIIGHGKETTQSTSKAPVAVNTSRKRNSGPQRKLPFHGFSKSTFTPRKTPGRVHSGLENHGHTGETSETASASMCCCFGSTSTIVKRNTQRFGLKQKDSSTRVLNSSIFKPSNQGANNGANSSRYNPRNLRCNPTPDVVVSDCSASNTTNNNNSTPVLPHDWSKQGSSSTSLARKDVDKDRICEPESSLSVRGKKIDGPMPNDRRIISSSRSISISNSRQRSNLSPPGDNDNTTSLRKHESMSRTRCLNRENQNGLPLVESPLLIPSSSQLDISLDATAFNSENQFSAQDPSGHISTFSRLGSPGNYTWTNEPAEPCSYINQDPLREYHLGGMVEFLLALEGSEPEEEPAYEQFLAMESNFSQGGHAFHDQYRNMRLDIDDMSYEDLLALEERIGTVSTALPEDVWSQCLKRSIYHGIVECEEDEGDVKCCVCQEDYADGDELGRLGCNHKYHIECIQQWLRLKNWCPTCKVSAAPSSP